MSIDKLHNYLCNNLSIFYIDFRVILCYNKDNGKGGRFFVPIIYKLDVLASLKEAGYNTNKIRKEKLLSEGVLQSLRSKKYISMDNLSRICELLDCQPADIIEYVKDAPTDDNKGVGGV